MITLPLSEKLRPATLQKVVGQTHIVGENGFISKVIESKNPVSILLWGPPGCGKTTIARLYARAFAMRFVSLSAVFSGVADIKKIIKETKETPLFSQTILFVDEIHRFNKAQQDAFLPFLEDGTLILVGSTTENPSFHLNDALLSRMRVLVLSALSKEELEDILVSFEARYGLLPIVESGRNLLIDKAQGDGRYLLNLVENIQNVVGKDSQTKIEKEELESIIQRRPSLFDRSGEQHYNLISALHKSVRGSDPDAALYWFARMIEGGEDPLFIARRIIRMAAEDVGLADPQALPLAISARDAYQMLGTPEGELALAEAVVYLALAPKSNAIYTAFAKAKECAKQTNNLAPPKVILNSPTKLMKQLNYGKDYKYDHDEPFAFSGQNYFPDQLARQQFYKPVERGFEREMKKRGDYFSGLRGKLC